METNKPISTFIKRNYRHFNAAVLVDAANEWVKLLKRGGKMFLTLAGAASTAELGISIAPLIRMGAVSGICTTGANLEESLFDLVAHNSYERLPNYRNLSDQDEVRLRDRGLSRVTDTCIPEGKAMETVGKLVQVEWVKATKNGTRKFPHQYLYDIVSSLIPHAQIDFDDCWMIAAADTNLPIFTPGWEDSTLGNRFVAESILGKVDIQAIKWGGEAMAALVSWYSAISKSSPIGFFQLGGGIAGDFPICVVPLMTQDLDKKCRLWEYFCQISDSTTSFGSYSGAVPNEKITWHKLNPETPRFVIESDYTICFPIIAQYVLEQMGQKQAALTSVKAPSINGNGRPKPAVPSTR